MTHNPPGFSRPAFAAAALAATLLASPVQAGAQSANDWITINKDYSGQRYVDLDQITPANVGGLKEVCEFQLNEPNWFTSGLLMVDRTIYASTWRATYAINAATCDLRWRSLVSLQKLPPNLGYRGGAYMDGMIFRGTADGRLMALDAKTGNIVWDVPNADPARKESFVAAPIAWDGKVFIGIATSDIGIRGRLMAFDARTGHELWRFYTIPKGDEPGAETWGNKPNVPPAGGGFWSTFSLDPATGEVFGPVANPYPDYTLIPRPGSNLYTNSVISLNASTGRLNWYFQAVPHDEHDWDLGTAPSLYRTLTGKDMLSIAGKDGHVYGIDRATHTAVFRTPGTTIANTGPIDETPKLVCPGSIGGAQWNGTAYHADIGALYVGMVDWCFFYFKVPGRGPDESAALGENFAAPPRGWITAMDGESGRVLWQYRTDAQMLAGLVPTKSGILFAGDVRGNLLALDARTGFLLNRIDAKGALNNGLISYAVNGTQYVAAAVGGTALNPSGIAGALRVSIYGLNGSDTPKIMKADRLPLLGATRQEQAGLMYAQVCVLCHGPEGRGGAYPSLVRQAKTVSDPNALKAFLATVPPPMPRLYPGMLEDGDVALIAEYLKGVIGVGAETSATVKLPTPPGAGVVAVPQQVPKAAQTQSVSTGQLAR